ncbi:MAG: alpha-amylase family glycosyl hydrolase [Chitinophagaceae bacterium]
MAAITSVNDIDLKRLQGKQYTNFTREWREEFIYFLMVDRFHDGLARIPVTGNARSAGIQTPDHFYGGTIKGITRNLDYIAGLGCTAIWLSPVFENNDGAYHGYNIRNYLNIDPHFGTKDDLVELVNAAHGYQKNGEPYPIRIILDVVINHSGDNWFYKNEDQPGVNAYTYFNDLQFDFGDWRNAAFPLPAELRNPDLYHRRGNMQNYDTYPENQHGDMSGLKDYSNDDDADGSELINILIRAHCYWIREADIDGFRVDAVKHMGELACSRFCSGIREYAYSLGKRNFFLFGELAVTSDAIYNRYIGQNTSRADNQTVYFGINSLLDFRLAKGIDNDPSNAGLRQIIRGSADPSSLFNRLKAQESRALNRGEIGRYLVSFVDNHDSFWQPDGRIAAGSSDGQVIASIGFLLCALGTPCIYYGTEQGFTGSGSDNNMREAMFDKNDPSRSLLNTVSTIYKEIAKIAEVMRTQAPLRFGRMYYRTISGNGTDFGLPFGNTYTLAFSRLLYGTEILVAYNVSSEERNDFISVESSYHRAGDTLNFLYGDTGSVRIHASPGGGLSVQLNLKGHQFVVMG